MFRRSDRIHPRVVAACVAAVVACALVAPAVARSKPSARSKPRVVVAVVDTAVNPYHEYFHAGGSLYKESAPSSVTPAVLEEFGIDKDHIIELTRTGNFEADFAKDKAEFDAIEKGEPYWFKGTNVIGISFEADGQRLRPDGNESPHGIGTISAVLTANPEAIVVSVDGINESSEEWAFTHPAVDIVSTSYGPATSYPTLTNLSNSYAGVVENGKVHFGASANDPTLSPLDQTSGPWWTVGIGGVAEEASGGREPASGSVPDFLGDWTQELPYCRNCEKGKQSVSGTSFATPRSAGTFSAALLQARRASGHRGGVVTKGDKLPLMVTGKFSFTNWELRRALEEAAYYPSAEDYQPGPTIPIPEAAPWTQAGWGIITPDPARKVIQEMLAHLGVKGKPTRTKSAEACEFMTANMEARHAYWDNAAVLSESFGKSEDPYIYC